MIKCSIYDRCGGCQLLHKAYEEGLNSKWREVVELFKNAKLDGAPNAIIGQEDPYRYRNKMQITFKRDRKGTIGGFYEESTHQVVGLDECIIHSIRVNEIAAYLPKLIDELHLLAYDEDRQTGLIRHALIKESFSKGELMVVIITADEIFPARSEFVKRLKAKFPGITTIIQNINPRKTSIVLGEKERILYGPGWISDSLCGLRFKITSKSFFQVNPKQTEVLYGLVEKYAALQGKEIVLDAYSGVGTIGLVLSKHAKHVHCVENNAQAVKAGISNAKDNQIKNLTFHCEDATDFLNQIADVGDHIDCLIMDPPRSGSTPSFLASILKLKPQKVVYVSCDPTTLVRDLALLQKGYRIVESTCVDMFCWTKHIETVVSLEKIVEKKK